jgi:hypothetical protein
MGIEYYAFALFITGLVCLIAIICKVLFGSVNRKNKLLDEKETKLLQLYQTVESIMEDFNDLVKAAADEIKEYERRASLISASLAQPSVELRKIEPAQAERLPRTERTDTNKPRGSNRSLVKSERTAKSDAQTQKGYVTSAKSDDGMEFQRYYDETLMQAPPTAAEINRIQTRSETILALAEDGKTDAQIARELGITQNEVRLIIGINKKRA